MNYIPVLQNKSRSETPPDDIGDRGGTYQNFEWLLQNIIF